MKKQFNLSNLEMEHNGVYFYLDIFVREFIKLDKEFQEKIVEWACQFNELSTTEDILNWWRKGECGARKIKNKFNKLIGDKLK